MKMELHRWNPISPEVKRKFTNSAICSNLKILENVISEK
jgi:hypothetical protein